MHATRGFLVPTGTRLCHAAVCVEVLDHLPAGGGSATTPGYSCAILRRSDDCGIGMIAVRPTHGELVERYIGHIGYGIDPPHRGHTYAAQACLAVRPILRQHGIDPAWITCDPDNLASRRTCERLGAELVEVVDTPAWTGLHRDGGFRKCRYRWRLEAMPV